MWSTLLPNIWYITKEMDGSVFVVTEDGDRFRVRYESPLTLNALKGAIGVS